MLNLQEVEAALQGAVKARNQVAADTLRGLKTRIQNDQIAKGKELSEADILSLVQSEVKRRREAAEAFRNGGRNEAADKEEAEARVLTPFLPPQASEEEIARAIDEKMADNSWTVKDFGSAMGLLKQHFGNSADGAVISKILKTKLK